MQVPSPVISPLSFIIPGGTDNITPKIVKIEPLFEEKIISNNVDAIEANLSYNKWNGYKYELYEETVILDTRQDDNSLKRLFNAIPEYGEPNYTGNDLQVVIVIPTANENRKIFVFQDGMMCYSEDVSVNLTRYRQEGVWYNF